MATNGVQSRPYAPANRAAAVRRLHVLHDVYSPAGRRAAVQAGVRHGMRVADFGCGIGATTAMLAELVGPRGAVTGIDANGGQLSEASAWCASQGLRNTSFLSADAGATGLPRDFYDVAYCRFLSLRLPDPTACLREMRRVLRPGGILLVEDGDLASAISVPRAGLDRFADLFSRFGPSRGLDYSLVRNRDLYQMVTGAGFSDVRVEVHQPAITRGEQRFLLKWSVEEAGPAFVDAGIITLDQLERTLAEMQDAIDDPEVLILAPRMSMVWGRKADEAERGLTSNTAVKAVHPERVEQRPA